MVSIAAMTRYPALHTGRRLSGGLAFLPFLLVGVILVAMLGFGLFRTLHTDTIHGCTVIEKDRTRGTDGASDMRVYTENCGVFQVADSLLSWTFSSADTYNEIEVGKTYDFDVRGLRMPLFSSFQNITDAREVR